MGILAPLGIQDEQVIHFLAHISFALGESLFAKHTADEGVG